jgi:hypothetical protein
MHGLSLVTGIFVIASPLGPDDFWALMAGARALRPDDSGSRIDHLRIDSMFFMVVSSSLRGRASCSADPRTFEPALI